MLISSYETQTQYYMYESFLSLHMLLCNCLMEQNQIKKVIVPLSLTGF